MLFFFNRLTFGLQTQFYVKLLAIACGITYLATLLTITFGCHPIHLNWRIVPYPPLRCTLRPQNFYVGTTLNVVTDAAMLCIPLPLLWNLQVPLRKKIALGVLLCSGVVCWVKAHFCSIRLLITYFASDCNHDSDCTNHYDFDAGASFRSGRDNVGHSGDSCGHCSYQPTNSSCS